MQLITPIIIKKKHMLVRLTALVLFVVSMTALLAPTVFAKNTYVITDGDQVKVYSTYATNPVEVLNLAGFELDADDTYTTQAGDGVSEITVRRSQNILVNNCGREEIVNSYGESLADLLNRLGVPATGEYRVSLPMDTVTYDGMQVTVEHIVQLQECYTVEIPYTTIYCNDPNLLEGEEKVLVAGTAGQAQVTASVVYINKVESSRTVLEETVVQQPVDRIVAVGTGDGASVNANAPAIGDGVIVTASGEILTYSSTMQVKTTAYSHFDAGCDMITATGTTVRVGTVAVDPKLIPYGTRMFIVSNDGQYIYGIATAEDCGGGVKGNHIDLYFPTVEKCFEYGVRSATVYFLT